MKTADREALVSVVVPMLDELGFIDECLAGFAAQHWPKDRLEVLVVDGGSTDGSRAWVDAYAREHPWVRVLDNPAGRTQVAENIGVRAASGEVICIFSAHGIPAPTYVARSVAALEHWEADGVGGRYDNVGAGRTGRAIGLAQGSRFAMASPHRFARSATEVDTISHPAYRRRVFDRLGGFDETIERNDDYEFNWRARSSGHRLVYDPSIVSVYRPRAGLKALAVQFFWYGRWKADVILRAPRSAKARHFVPPLFALTIALLGIGGPRSRRKLAALVGCYAAATAAATAEALSRTGGGEPADPATVAAAFPVMHLSWGVGFLTTLARRPRAHGPEN